MVMITHHRIMAAITKIKMIFILVSYLSKWGFFLVGRVGTDDHSGFVTAVTIVDNQGGILSG
jgi:hypothetical protein